MKRYFWNILISFDQFVNTIFGGDPDETISSRLGKGLDSGQCVFCRYVCRVLDVIDPGHCKKSIEMDEGSSSTWGAGNG